METHHTVDIEQVDFSPLHADVQRVSGPSQNVPPNKLKNAVETGNSQTVKLDAGSWKVYQVALTCIFYHFVAMFVGFPLEVMEELRETRAEVPKIVRSIEAWKTACLMISMHFCRNRCQLLRLFSIVPEQHEAEMLTKC